MIRRTLWIVAIVFAALIAPAVLRAADITYNVDQIVGAGSSTGTVTGTITTDGTIGALSGNDIVSVDLFLTVPGPPTYNMTGDVVSYSLTPGTPVDDCGITCGLTASATTIMFNFSAGNGTYFDLGDTGTPNEWCLSSSIDCGPNQTGGADFVTVGDPTVSSLGLTGEVEIASNVISSTPEPGTGGLLLIGAGLLGFMMVMRKRSARGLLQAS